MDSKRVEGLIEQWKSGYGIVLDNLPPDEVTEVYRRVEEILKSTPRVTYERSCRHGRHGRHDA